MRLEADVHTLLLPLHIALALAAISVNSPLLAQARHAPPGMFKHLDDEIAGSAVIVHGKQLFVDDYLIDEMQGVQRVLRKGPCGTPALCTRYPPPSRGG